MLSQKIMLLRKHIQPSLALWFHMWLQLDRHALFHRLCCPKGHNLRSGGHISFRNSKSLDSHWERLQSNPACKTRGTSLGMCTPPVSWGGTRVYLLYSLSLCLQSSASSACVPQSLGSALSLLTHTLSLLTLWAPWKWPAGPRTRFSASWITKHPETFCKPEVLWELFCPRSMPHVTLQLQSNIFL